MLDGGDVDNIETGEFTSTTNATATAVTNPTQAEAQAQAQQSDGVPRVGQSSFQAILLPTQPPNPSPTEGLLIPRLEQVMMDLSDLSANQRAMMMKLEAIEARMETFEAITSGDRRATMEMGNTTLSSLTTSVVTTFLGIS